MTPINLLNKTSEENKRRFYTELKLFINQKLYEKQIIDESMYHTVKEKLIKQTN